MKNTGFRTIILYTALISGK